MPRPLLPIGFVGYTKKKNIQSSKWGVKDALFIITDYNARGKNPYPYVVKFLDNRFKDLNDVGPFLSRNCISKRKVNNETVRILYGR